MAQQNDSEPNQDLATRTGALAMLLHSIGTTLETIFQMCEQL
jgi:hypothetical protein